MKRGLGFHYKVSTISVYQTIVVKDKQSYVRALAYPSSSLYVPLSTPSFQYNSSWGLWLQNGSANSLVYGAPAKSRQQRPALHITI